MFGPGARIPSRNAIITKYGVGETAAKHALQVLATEGLIEARPGSGSYVRKVPAARLLEHDRPEFPGSPFGVREAVTGGGDPPGGAAPPMTRRLAWEHQTEQLPAPPQIARRLRLADGTVVTTTRYLLTSDGEPVQLAVSYEPAELTAGTPVAVPEQGRGRGRHRRPAVAAGRSRGPGVAGRSRGAGHRTGAVRGGPAGRGGRRDRPR
jgi:GntR family transcriptional regulator